MKKEKINLKKIKIIILIILLIILVITSFKTGSKFYTLRNTNFNTTVVKNKSIVSRWNFTARIKQNTNITAENIRFDKI